MSAAPALFTDADNTLWDTDDVYRRAQIELLEQLAFTLGIILNKSDADSLGFVRHIDQNIAAQHPSGLKYPPSLLALGLARALKGDLEGATNLALLTKERYDHFTHDIEKYEAALKFPPRLRRGVAVGLRNARDLYSRTLVITEGSLNRCIALLEQNGLTKLVTDCVAITKDVSTFRSLALNDTTALMVGDQLDRDILFAGQAGLRTCYFPGNFRPFWLQSVSAEPDFQINSYSEIPNLLTKIVEENATRPRKRSGWYT